MPPIPVSRSRRRPTARSRCRSCVREAARSARGGASRRAAATEAEARVEAAPRRWPQHGRRRASMPAPVTVKEPRLGCRRRSGGLRYGRVPEHLSARKHLPRGRAAPRRQKRRTNRTATSRGRAVGGAEPRGRPVSARERRARREIVAAMRHSRTLAGCRAHANFLCEPAGVYVLKQRLRTRMHRRAFFGH